MMRIVFEKREDTYSNIYLLVSLEEQQDSFLKIYITDKKQIQFIFYARKSIIRLSVDELTKIRDEGSLLLAEDRNIESSRNIYCNNF